MAASSSSSTDGGAALAAGTAVADFTVERVLGEGPRGIVYEATQAGLRRRVALKVYRPQPGLATRFDALRWPEHPHVVSLYAAGACEHGFFTATRLIRGPTLAQLVEHWPLEPGRAEQLCDEVGGALAAAHGAGIAHGAVHAGNVFVDVDGRALLADFVPAEGGAPAAADDAALAQLRARCAQACGAARTPRHARRRLAAGVGLAGLGVAVVAVAALLALRPAAPEPAGAPAPAAGVIALGSSLAAPAARSVTCDGEAANGSSLPCIVMQTRLPGRRVVVAQDGVIRDWFVRGAAGELALHVMRPWGRRFVSVGKSALQRVPDGAVPRLAASLAVQRGDRIAVEVTPGAAIGVGAEASGAATTRFIAPRRAIPMTPTADLPARFDHELLVRVDYAPGARLAWPSALAGRRAARAPAGRVLARHVVSAGDRTRTVVLVSLEDRIALDLFAGARRLMRVAIPEADPAGRLVRTEVSSLPDATVIWENADGIVTTSFRIGVSGLTAT